jgi:hypothetical protein
MVISFQRAAGPVSGSEASEDGDTREEHVGRRGAVRSHRRPCRPSALRHESIRLLDCKSRYLASPRHRHAGGAAWAREKSSPGRDRSLRAARWYRQRRGRTKNEDAEQVAVGLADLDAGRRGHGCGAALWGKLVEELDADHDGVMSTAEFQAGALARWTEADAKKDGKVTADGSEAMHGKSSSKTASLRTTPTVTACCSGASCAGCPTGCLRSSTPARTVR